MKKKKVLFGIFMVSLALASLSSCTGKKDKNTNKESEKISESSESSYESKESEKESSKEESKESSSSDNNIESSSSKEKESSYSTYSKTTIESSSESNEIITSNSTTESIIKYTVTWKNYDGEILKVDENLDSGTLPSYTGDKPTKPSDDNYDYEFIGWDKEFEEISSNVEYVAVFKEIPILKLQYELTGDKTGYIVTGCNKNITELVIPETYNDLPVIGIYNYSFKDCTMLKKVTIPSGVVTYYPEDSENAFKNCPIEDATIPSNIIRDICNDKLTNLTIIDEIDGNYLVDDLKNCKSLKNLELPASLKSIDDIFADCESLENVYFDGTLEDWFNVRFDNEESNPMRIANNFYLLDSNGIIEYNKNKYTFLEEINIPNTISSISYQLCGFNQIKKLSIPASITTINSDAFLGVTSLETIVVDENNKKYDSRDNSNAIIQKSNNTLIRGCSNTVIPESVTSLGLRAFQDCTSLESIIIPESVTSIGNAAFEDCTSLKSMTIPNSVTSIGYCAFMNCASLENIVLSNNISALNDYVFENCTSLKTITIPDGVTTISDGALHNCELLESIIIPENVTYIGLRAFEDCKSLKGITIPKNVTYIGSSILRGCTSLTSIVVDGNNTIFDSRDNSNAIIVKKTNSLVIGCSNTKIPESVTSIKKYAFYGCTLLETITIPESVTSIEEYAFYGCTSLKSITIPDSVTEIYNGVFENCTSLESIIIPKNVTYIGAYILSGCTSLTSIVVDENNTVYDSRNNSNAIIEKKTNSLLFGCSNTKIPDSVTSIKEYAFYGCSSLKSITIPESVTNIGMYSFSDCTSLTTIIIPKSVSSIPYYAFGNCINLSDITFNGTQEEWKSVYNDGLKPEFVSTNVIHCTDGDIAL